MSSTTHAFGQPHFSSVQGSLALDLVPRLDPPDVPAALDGRRFDLVQVDAPTRAHLERWVPSFVQAATEIVTGERPASQLLRWTSPEVHLGLTRRAHVVAQAAGRDGLVGRRRAHSSRPQVISSRLSFVTADVVEGSAHVRHGKRSRAVAVRFEWRKERWVCTALEWS